MFGFITYDDEMLITKFVAFETGPQLSKFLFEFLAFFDGKVELDPHLGSLDRHDFFQLFDHFQ